MADDITLPRGPIFTEEEIERERRGVRYVRDPKAPPPTFTVIRRVRSPADGTILLSDGQPVGYYRVQSHEEPVTVELYMTLEYLLHEMTAAELMQATRRIGQMAYEYGWQIVILRELEVGEDAARQLTEAFYRAVIVDDNPFATHPLFAGGFMPVFWMREAVGSIKAFKAAEHAPDNPEASGFLDFFAYDEQGIPMKDISMRIRRMQQFAREFLPFSETFRAIFKLPRWWLYASSEFVYGMGEGRVQMARYIRAGHRTGLPIYPRLASTGRPLTTMHTLVPRNPPVTFAIEPSARRHSDDDDDDIPRMPPIRPSLVPELGGSITLMKPTLDELESVKLGRNILVDGNLLVPVERYGTTLGGGSYYPTTAAAQAAAAEYCGTFYYHAPGSSILLNCGPPERHASFFTKYEAIEALLARQEASERLQEYTDTVLSVGLELFRVLLANVDTYASFGEYESYKSKWILVRKRIALRFPSIEQALVLADKLSMNGTMPDTIDGNYLLSNGMWDNLNADGAVDRAFISDDGRAEVRALMSGRRSAFFKFLDPFTYRDSMGLGRYMGQMFYAVEDPLDEPLCRLGGRLRVNVMEFTTMAGQHRTVGEALDTRQRDESYRKLVYLVL